VARLAAALRAYERIGLDTSVFIYHIEGSSPQAVPAATALDELNVGAFEGVTSVITLMELIVKPLQMNRPDVADSYEALLVTYPNLNLVRLDRTTARRAAELRATYRLRPADALQVAACVQAGARAFLTNDKALRRVGDDVAVLLLDDFLAEDSGLR